MECKLGKALGCEGLSKEGNCSVFFKEGVALRMDQGICEFKNIRAPRIGINAPKKGKMLNPIKAAKAAAKAAGVVVDAA
jgi:hypothetical protein